jgi:hypothetical protein
MGELELGWTFTPTSSMSSFKWNCFLRSFYWRASNKNKCGKKCFNLNGSKISFWRMLTSICNICSKPRIVLWRFWHGVVCFDFGGKKTFLFAEATSRPRLGHPIFGEMEYCGNTCTYENVHRVQLCTWLDTNCDRRNGLCSPRRCMLLASCSLVIYASVLQNSFSPLSFVTKI